MLPIPEKAWVTGEYIVDWKELKTGEACVVLTLDDGIVFKTDCPGSPWRKTPCTNEQIQGPLFVPQGTPLPLKNEMTYTELPKDSMFVFSRNISDPACCPATYSTDRGCVCTTAQQRKLIGQTRGNNKNFPNYSF